MATAIYDGADEWTILQGLIDDDNAYVTQRNPNWTTYRDVALVAQTAWLGYNVRWTENKEELELGAQQDASPSMPEPSTTAWLRRSPKSTTCSPGPSHRASSARAEVIPPFYPRQPPSGLSPLRGTTCVPGTAPVGPGNRLNDQGFIAQPMESKEIVTAFARLPSMNSGSSKVLDRYWREHIMIEAPYVRPDRPRRQRPGHGHGHRRLHRRGAAVTTPDHRPGEVAWVKCGHPLEDPDSAGKWRPMVLVRRVGCNWMAAGLTSQARYADGTPRVAVVQPRWAGLRRGPSYLWGENLTRVSALDVGNHIGWAHPSLVGQIEEHYRLNAADRAALSGGIQWPEAG